MGAGRVAAFSAELRFDALPPAVVHRARLALRDTVGTLLAGRTTLAARAAAAAVAADGGTGGPVHVVTSGRRAGRIAGALANGVAASSLDFDDGHVLGGSIHPGGAIVPALLAAAAEREVTVEDLVVALVAAYETAIRAGWLLWPEDRSYQAHLAGTPAAIGGAVGCALLGGLDAAGVRRALEIGWAHAPLAALQFPMVKESLGWAAATAVSSALLAGGGFKRAGSQGDDAFGYAAHPPTGFDRPAASEDPFVMSLGERWEIEQTYFKPYAACRFTHTAADAIRELREQAPLDADDVASVEVRTHREAAYLNGAAPDTLEAAQYSFPWVVAAMLRDDEVGPAQVAPERLRDPAVAELAARVAVVHDASLDAAYPDAYPSAVAVRLHDGSVRERRVDVARGAPERPLSDEELRDKFTALASSALPDERVAAIDAAIMDGGVGAAALLTAIAEAAPV